MFACSTHVKVGIIASIGIVLGIAGGVLYGVFPGIFKSKIAKAAVLKESNGAVFDAWKSSPVPVYFKLYFFNVTNEDEYKTNSSIRPRLQEIGPYTFRELRTKEDIKFVDDGNLVYYSNSKKFQFVPRLSVGSLSDQISTINLPLAGIAKKLQNFPLLIQRGADSVLDYFHEDLFVRKTVSELGFDGYKEPLVKFLQDKFALSILPDSTFGLFYEAKVKEGNDGLFEVYTGKKDSNRFTEIKSWNNATQLNYWGSPYCNMINGTDGSQYPPSVTKDDVLYAFSTDLCRSLNLVYEKEISHYEIPNYRFVAPESLFANPLTNPSNRCFCTSKDPSKCLGAGLLDVSKCRQGAPVVMSAPHFYQGDKKYLDAVEGLNPSKNKHETYLDVEYNTGIVMEAAKRVQINVHIQRSRGITPFKNVKDMIFPIVWIEETATIDKSSAEKFKEKVIKPKEIVYGVIYTLFALGCIFLVITLISTILIQKKAKKIIKVSEGEVNYAMKDIH